MTDPLRGNMQPHHSSGVKYDPTHKYFSRIEKRPTNRFIRATHDPVSGASNKSGKNLDRRFVSQAKEEEEEKKKKDETYFPPQKIFVVITRLERLKKWKVEEKK